MVLGHRQGFFAVEQGTASQAWDGIHSPARCYLALNLHILHIPFLPT